jgi:hypothetical protein
MFQETDDKVPTDEITEGSTENESPTKTDLLDRNRDHGPDVPRPNVCIQMYESESGK